MNDKNKNSDETLLKSRKENNGNIPDKICEIDGLERKESVVDKLELKKELGVLYSVAVIVGLIIGGGIYIAPQNVLRHAQSPGLTLVIWFIGGLFSFLGALCFAEIGLKIPISGGKYAFFTEFYGPYFGFIYLWQYLLLVRPGSNALKVSILSNFLLKLFFPTCPIPTTAIKCLASFFTVGICVINCLSVKLVAKSQTLMTIFSMGTLLAISIVGVQHIASENLQEPFANSTSDLGDLVLALYNTIFSYAGWGALSNIIEEVKNPERTLPLSISISMSIMICLYMLVNLSYLAVLSTAEMLESEAVAISVALKVWPPLAWIFSICIAISSCSSFNSGVLTGSRIAFAGARNGQIPKVVSYISVTQLTPTISVLLQAVLVLCYIWFAKIDFLIQNLTFSHLFIDVIILLAFVKIRWREDKNVIKTHFRLPLFLFIFYIVLVSGLCVVPLVTKPLETALVFGFILISTSMIYVIFMIWKPSCFTSNSYIEGFYRWMQIVFSSAPPDKSS